MILMERLCEDENDMVIFDPSVSGVIFDPMRWIDYLLLDRKDGEDFVTQRHVSQRPSHMRTHTLFWSHKIGDMGEDK